MRFPLPAVAAALLLTLFAPSPAQDVAPAPAAPQAKAWLSAALADAKRSDAVLAALRVSNDKAAVPIFGALTRSGDRRARLAATAAIARLAPQESVPFLLERLREDSLHAVRAEALAHLREMKAVQAPQLESALQVDDDNVRCLAARGLVQLGQSAKAQRALAELSKSKDLYTSTAARLCLLGLGENEHLEAVTQAFKDAGLSAAALTLLLQQIEEEKIAPAAPIARDVAASDRPVQVRVMAYKALIALSPKPASMLAEAVTRGRDLFLRVHLVNLLASQADNQEALTSLAGDDGTVGALARLELARSAKGPAIGKAASDAFALGHPVVVDYVLDRCGKDIAALGEKADPYTPALLEFIRSTQSEGREMTGLHVRTARAATLLCDLGTPAALAGVKELLAGRHTTVVQAVSAGMRWSKNRAVCEIARTLLNNPYRGVATDAALTLGMFADPAGTEPLKALLARADREQVPLMAMVCWYLLKIEGQAADAAAELAKEMK